MTPTQVSTECDNQMTALQPKFLGQAQSQCANDIQGLFRQNIPTSLQPQYAYPQALSKCANLRYALQGALNKLANAGANQKAPMSSLMPQIQLCNKLQNQYNNQKNLCLMLKASNLIEGQIPALQGQLNRLVPAQNWLVGQNVPQNLQPQVFGLQKQIGGLVTLQLQNVQKLANLYAPNYSNALASPAYSSCVNQICMLKTQQEFLMPAMSYLAGQVGQPANLAQVQSMCNEAASNLKPSIYQQAQNLVTPAIQMRFSKLAGPKFMVSPMNMKLALQLVLQNNIQNQLTTCQNAANALKGQPSQLVAYNKLNNIANNIQNRLNNEQEIGNMYKALISIQNMINQIQPQTSNQPSQLNYLTPTNYLNQAKLAYLGNLQYLANVNIANHLQQGIQALTSCANDYGSLANSAPNALLSQQYGLQNQAARNALSQCQNQYQGLANTQIPQAQQFYNTLQSNCNNLKSTLGKNPNYNLANLESQAQDQCKSALAVIIDITAVVETNVHTTTNVHTSGQPGSGEAQVSSVVSQNAQAEKPVQMVKTSSFLSMNSRQK